jgi:hypothetical protein
MHSGKSKIQQSRTLPRLLDGRITIVKSFIGEAKDSEENTLSHLII